MKINSILLLFILSFYPLYSMEKNVGSHFKRYAQRDAQIKKIYYKAGKYVPLYSLYFRSEKFDRGFDEGMKFIIELGPQGSDIRLRERISAIKKKNSKEYVSGFQAAWESASAIYRVLFHPVKR